MKIYILIAGLGLLFCNCTKPKSLVVSSPDGALEIRLDNKDDKLSYKLYNKDTNIISNSEISIFQGKEIKIVNTKTRLINENWEPVWGQFSEIEDNCKELEVSLEYDGIPAKLLVRTYNKGVAFRFNVLAIPKNARPSFLIEYGLPETSVLYSPAGEREPIGPFSIDSLGQLDSMKYHFKMPMVVEHHDNGFLSLLESDLISAPGFKLIDFSFDKNRNKLISESEFVKEEGSLTTPWRVILVEDKIGDLLTNTIPLNVAAPNEIKNSSWIKPGKTVWDWRVHGYKAKDGFIYGIDNESYFRFIDFAAENGIEYFMIDDAWYSAVKPGYIQMSEKLDLDKVTSYAKDKGVSLLLYYDRRLGDYGDEALFPYYKSLEMKGIKYGFMGNNVSFTRNAIQKSAESQLLIDFHDNPVPFTGVTRTYPNAITREFCHAQQDSRRAFSPETFVRMALINAIQGPLDMNNGIFDITGVNAGKREKGPKKRSSLNTTVAAEAARTLIIFSGLVCIPDAPEAYEAKKDLFEFIKKIPVGKWDETRVLHAKMDQYISTARRHEDEWFIGSVHSKGGVLEIPLDFLKENSTYSVTYYEDTEKTDSRTNPEAYQVRTNTVKKGDIIPAKMVAGGGHCMWIRPVKSSER